MPKGTLVIRAAEMIGITIPRFCDHPLLDPIGACRQCLVDIEGQRKPLASCTTVCTDGMVVKTQFTSAVADKAQQGVMELLLDQPPARLPDVRQGRRVPAAEPGHVQRPGRVPVPRGQARVRQAGGDLDRGAARPGAVHLLHPLRAHVGGDRGRRLHRVPRARARGSTSAPPRASRSTPTSPATPSRSARSGRSPARRTGSSPARSTWCPRRASASTARPGASCAPTTGAAGCCAAWPARSRWSTRSGTATRAAGRSAYATESDRLTTPLVRDGDGVLRPASWAAAFAAAARGLAAARDADRRDAPPASAC